MKLRFYDTIGGAHAAGSPLRYDDGHLVVLDARAGRYIRLDANQTAFLERQLEFVQEQVYRAKQQPLSSSRLIPRSSRVAAGTASIGHRKVEHFGSMDPVADGATDLSRVGYGKSDSFTPVRDFACCFLWTHFDLLRAALTGEDLSVEDGFAARRAYEERVNKCAWYGDDDLGLLGMLNILDIPMTAADDLFTNLSAENVMLAITGEVKAIMNGTDNAEVPNMTILPTDVYLDLADTRQGSADNTEPLLDEVEKKVRKITMNPDYRIDHAPELKADPMTGEHVMLTGAFSPQNVEQHVPLQFTQLPTQQSGLNYQVPCIAQIGSVECRYPKAFRKLRNIA